MGAPRGRAAVVAVPCSIEPTFSFVVPVLNEEEAIVRLLQKLGALYPHSEIVVVDGGSNDQTVARAMPLCNSVMTCLPGRARQMNLGGAAVSGDYVFFLHADTLPTLDADGMCQALEQGPQWGFSKVRLTGQRHAFRLIEWAMNQRSRISQVATGDQMIFIRRNVLMASNGYADIPLMEDIELCKRLRQKSAPLIIESPVLTSSRRWETRGVWRTVLQMWYLRLSYFLGVSPSRLWEQYYGR